MLLAFGVHMAVAAADRVPWQRRIGKNVDIHHKKQHERVRPDMWPAEPPTLKDVNVAKFTDAVYVLHCFQKKTEKTSKADVDLAAKRYRDLVKELGQ